MRFLLFNLVVAGALVFLFASDKADLHAAADRAHQAATGIKARAIEAYGAKETTPAGPTRATDRAKAPPHPFANPVKTAKTAAPKPVIGQKSPTLTSDIKAKPAAIEAVRQIRVATRKLVPPLPPEVEKRRKEVLGNTAVPATRPSPQNFMSTVSRKRDLMLLSEEMEMFSAKSISR